MADDLQLDRNKGAVPMGGAINRSFISAHFLLSTYFLTAQTCKRMCLITRVYGIHKFPRLQKKNPVLIPDMQDLHMNVIIVVTVGRNRWQV